jgi:hypothetical protein
MSFPASKKARIWLISTGFLVLASACGHPMQRRLQGRWLGESVDNVDQPLLAAATGWAKGTSFEFAGDRMTVIIPTEEPRSGTFDIGSVHDDKIALLAKRPDGSVDRVELKLDDDHSLRWLLPNGSAIHMRKAN